MGRGQAGRTLGMAKKEMNMLRIIYSLIYSIFADPHFCALAEQEITDNKVDKGLWAKALMKSKGNENIRRAKYIKLRAIAMQREAIQKMKQ